MLHWVDSSVHYVPTNTAVGRKQREREGGMQPAKLVQLEHEPAPEAREPCARGKEGTRTRAWVVAPVEAADSSPSTALCTGPVGTARSGLAGNVVLAWDKLVLRAVTIPTARGNVETSRSIMTRFARLWRASRVPAVASPGVAEHSLKESRMELSAQALPARRKRLPRRLRRLR